MWIFARRLDQILIPRVDVFVSLCNIDVHCLVQNSVINPPQRKLRLAFSMKWLASLRIKSQPEAGHPGWRRNWDLMVTAWLSWSHGDRPNFWRRLSCPWLRPRTDTIERNCWNPPRSWPTISYYSRVRSNFGQILSRPDRRRMGRGKCYCSRPP